MAFVRPLPDQLAVFQGASTGLSGKHLFPAINSTDYVSITVTSIEIGAFLTSGIHEHTGI